jgi:glutamate racemase
MLAVLIGSVQADEFAAPKVVFPTEKVVTPDIVTPTVVTKTEEKQIDTLLLACTHYPLLVPILQEMIGDRVRIVDSASTCALHLQQELTRREMLAEPDRAGTLSIALTDLSEQFEVLAKRFLRKCPPRITRVEL